MPQPLMKVTSVAALTSGGPGFYALEKRPDLIPLAMRVITDWAALEWQVHETIIAILRAKAEPALAMLLALRSTALQQDVLLAAAKTALGDSDVAVLEKLSKLYRNVAKSRNAVAHATWAVCEQIQDGVVLFPAHVAAKYARTRGLRRIKAKRALDLGFEDMQVYKAKDFEDITSRIGALHALFSKFQDRLTCRRPKSERLLAELCTELGIK